MKPEDIIEERKRWEQHAHSSEANMTDGDNKLHGDIKEKLLNGEIIDEATRHWLDTEIATARIGLVASIIITALIKGQIFIWAILYIAYKCRVHQVKRKAQERTIKDYRRYLK